jgi:hypothetical protein
MTNAAAGVKFGGGGYSYGDYSLPSSKKPAPYSPEEEGKGSQLEEQKKKSWFTDDDSEIFLFTIKDPIKTVISKLMDLISLHGNEIIPQIDIKLAETGPLGYTSLFAFQPTFKGKAPESLIRAVVK